MTIPFQPIASWAHISPKVIKTFHKFYCGGCFSEEDAEAKGALLVTGSQGHRLMGNMVTFYWLIDQTNGVILDAKFQYFGHPFLLVLAETACNLLVGETYAYAYRITVTMLDQALRTQADRPALPDTCTPLYHCIIDALDNTAQHCTHLPLQEGSPSLPLRDVTFPEDTGDAHPHTKEMWEALSLEERLHALRTIIKEKIAPYVALDGGEVQITKLEENTVTIAYAGNCSGCISSVGSTLNSIGHLLRTYVYGDLHVTVDASSLHFLHTDESS